jgi:predicted transposase YbfD/YdcC
MQLIDCLKGVQETRSHINQTYPLLEVIFLVVTALACGQKGWSDIEDFGEGNLDWLRQYLPYENGIPTRHNIAKIIRAVVPETFIDALVQWANVRRTTQGKPLIAVDGKDVRGVQRSGKASPLSIVSAFDVEQGLVLYHHATEGKGQEIQAVCDLVDALDIKDCLVSLDALHCQSETLSHIKAQGGDAMVQVKKNQPGLFDDVDSAFQAYWQKSPDEQINLTSGDKGHGREETRCVYSLPATLSKPLKAKWPMVESLVAVIRTRKIGKAISHDTAYFACTTDLPLSLAADATRRHWHTENVQHWVLDVVFKEDAQTIYAGKAAQNMATVRRFVLNLLRRDTKKLSLPRKMNKAAWDGDYRHDLLFTN